MPERICRTCRINLPLHKEALLRECLHSPGSDIDIIVTLDRSQPIELKFFGMVIDLENLLQRPVDLVVDGDLLPFAKTTADRDKIMVYERAS